MPKDIDWDAIEADDEFEGAPVPPKAKAEPKKPEVKAQATVQTPPRRAEPPPVPPKQQAILSEKDEQMIEKTLKSVAKLNKSLETLDFKIEKFTKFEQRFSSFKIKNAVVLGSVAFLIGGYIGSLAQGELSKYYINQEVKDKKQQLEVMEKLEAAGFGFAVNDDVLQVYTRDPKFKLYESQGFKILQKNKK